MIDILENTEMAPGKLHFPDRYFQETDFSELSVGNMSPTDLDGMMEIHDMAYVFCEIKYRDKDLPCGQRLALERLAVDLTRAGKDVLVLVIEHDVANPKETVPVGQCLIRELFFGSEGIWRAPKAPISAHNAIYSFLDFADRKRVVA